MCVIVLRSVFSSGLPTAMSSSIIHQFSWFDHRIQQ